MRIAGMEKSSVVDYPGTVAAVLFVRGCNFDCWYCHNRELLEEAPPQGDFSTKSVLAFLKKRRGLLGGVVISGGEPTLQKDLLSFIVKVRAMDFLIKLDTNGSRPDVLKPLLESGMIDYVAMDVKAPLDRYDQTVCVPTDTDCIANSIQILSESKVAHEFRTTFVPTLSPGDIEDIARLIEDAPLYALQQYRRPAPAKASSIALGLPPHGREAIEEAVRLASPHVQKCVVRGGWF